MMLGDLQAAAADTATHRAALVIAFATIGETVPEVSVDALDEATRAAERIRTRLGAGSNLRSLADSLVDVTGDVEVLLAEGDATRARELVESDVLPAVAELASALNRDIATITGRIEAEQARAGGLARAASFVVALLVPILAVVLVRSLARRRLDRQRLESEVLRQKELGENRDRLIAGLSHQLRTPITGIYGWSELISQSPALAEEGAVAILSEAGDLRRMVDDILVTARLDADKLGYRASRQGVTGIISRAVEHFLRVGHSVEVDCEEAAVDVDAPRLEHALRNLISNAIGHGGAPVHIAGRTSDGYYRIAVIDHGDGLDGDRETDPFAMFAHRAEDITTANSLGLGLSVADSLARLMGGSLDYLRRDGRTVFSLTVPLFVSGNPEMAGDEDKESLPATVHSRA
jgi:K+-sensing histidine kinase KdpD